jgi:hypothetical protein
MLDVVIESDPKEFTGMPLDDRFGLLKDNVENELDDNVRLSVKDVEKVHHHDGKQAISVKTKMEHPNNIKITPVLLDDCRHLDIEL